MTIEIRIANLPPDTTEEEVTQLLSGFCRIDAIRLNGRDQPGTLAAWVEVPTNRTHGYLLVRKINTLVLRGYLLSAYVSLFSRR